MQSKTRLFWRSAAALFALIFLATGARAAAETGQPLTIGILPTLSARVLLKSYQPLRTYLEKELQRPIDLVTAANFKSFNEATLAGDFDVVVTAAHLARLAQTERQFVPLAAYKAPNRAVLISAKDRPLTSVQALRGQTLAIPDRHALIVSQAIQWLNTQGLHANTDYSLLETPSHNSAAHSVQSHESLLAIVSPAGWKQMPAPIRESVQIFVTLDEIPSLMWLANPKLGADRDRIRSALLGFTPATAEGAAFFESTGYKGLRPVSNDEMKSLEPYARDIANILRSAQ